MCLSFRRSIPLNFESFQKSNSTKVREPLSSRLLGNGNVRLKALSHLEKPMPWYKTTTYNTMHSKSSKENTCKLIPIKNHVVAAWSYLSCLIFASSCLLYLSCSKDFLWMRPIFSSFSIIFLHFPPHMQPVTFQLHFLLISIIFINKWTENSIFPFQSLIHFLCRFPWPFITKWTPTLGYISQLSAWNKFPINHGYYFLTFLTGNFHQRCYTFIHRYGWKGTHYISLLIVGPRRK